jgi:hypothetical protein
MRFHAAIRVGPAVDSYLQSQGALAQAVDRETVLASSSVLDMSSFDRRVILLHELAHVQQMATPGNDPVRALEAEAWEAAYAWLEGRPFRIRGRARAPLNAIAIIQGGAKGHPHAPAWYQASPVEPIGNKSTIKVEGTTLLESINLEAILDQIISSKATEVVIVCHGDGSGLAIPLRQGATVGAVKEAITILSADRRGEEEPELAGGAKTVTPARSDEDASVVTKLREPEVKTLRAKMNQVRGMKLKHVAFRACNMGISPRETMKTFRSFFGAASVSAPTEFDSYGRFSPSIGGDQEAWARSKKRDHFEVSVSGRVAFGTRDKANPVEYDIVANAASRDLFRAWVSEHVGDGAWGANGLVYHGVKVRHRASPTAPTVYFVRDIEFILSIVHYAG